MKLKFGENWSRFSYNLFTMVERWLAIERFCDKHHGSSLPLGYASFVNLGSYAMTDADKYRANVHHCLRMADDPLNWEHKRTWLNMAETWLGMIPEPGRPEKMFVRDQGTQQEPSKSRP
jgi:hypothetical protein